MSKSLMVNIARRTIPKSLRGPIRRKYKRLNLRRRITQYLQLVDSNDGAIKVVFGGHWSNHPDWLVIQEEEQDITKRLAFDDNQVDVIFTEHVIEHLNFEGVLNFFRESLRVLKPGGYTRIVCPGVDQLISTKFDQEKATQYCQNFLGPVCFPRENNLLKEIGLSIETDPHAFVINGNFRLHGHQFIWSAKLLEKSLHAIGYSRVEICRIGEGRDNANCIERWRRGLYLGNDWIKDKEDEHSFDMESIFVEAHK